MTVKGRRKDWIIWSSRKAIKKVFGKDEAYFAKMLEERPSNFDQFILKQVPQQIESTLKAEVSNVLHVSLPEPRRAVPVQGRVVRELEQGSEECPRNETVQETVQDNEDNHENFQ